jgi:hypothetical protein
MQHSSSLRCSGTPLANNPSSCTHSEYGDPYDPLGSGCRHTNAWQKAYMGWFGGCNRVRVNQSGTFTLHPLEVACNGIQVLQIPMPVTTRTIRRSGGGAEPSTDPIQFYYLELRTRTGFDQTMTNAPVVLVHVGPEFGESIITGKHTWILDMNPSTGDVDGLPVGQAYTDPAGGVAFTVESVSANGATVEVTVPPNGENTCADGGVLPSPGGATTCNGGVGAGGGAGADGTGGRATAGSGGGGGRAGAGAGGRGGASGAGASGVGNGGIAGSGSSGAAGAAGTSGGSSGGSNATGGVSGASSSAGDSMVGGASAGQGDPPDEDTDEEPGCDCRVPGSPNRREPGRSIGWLGFTVLALVRRRRRTGIA